MKADFIEKHVFAADDDANAVREWTGAVAITMKAKGATFMRWSHPPDKPREIYIEGWIKRPDEQGPHPWETSP